MENTCIVMRSDASYPPNPLYLMRESVMSLNATREPPQNYPNGHRGSHDGEPHQSNYYPQPPEGSSGVSNHGNGQAKTEELEGEGPDAPAYPERGFQGLANQRPGFFGYEKVAETGEAQVPNQANEKLDSLASGQSQAAAELLRETDSNRPEHSNHSQEKDLSDFQVQCQTQEKDTETLNPKVPQDPKGQNSISEQDMHSPLSSPTKPSEKSVEREGDRRSPNDTSFHFEGPPPSLDDLKQSLATEETPVPPFLSPSSMLSHRALALHSSNKSPPLNARDFQIHSTSTPNKELFSPSMPSRDQPVFHHLHHQEGAHNAREQSLFSGNTSSIKGEPPSFIRTPSREHSLFSTPSMSMYDTPGSADFRSFSQDGRQVTDFSAHSNSGSSGHSLSPSPLDSHVEQDHNGKDVFFCHLCSYVGSSKFHFQAHMNSHFEHACPHCDYKSRTEGRLKRHIKDFHSDDPPENFSGQKTMRTPGRPKVFKCKQCDFMSTTKTDFWEHARSHIKDDKVLQCPKCPFVTEYKHHLEYHLRNHFGSKPFKCPKCNYACVNKSMLNSHMKSHTNVYQYRCADCTYATKYCHSLKLHLRKYAHKPATVLNTDGSLPTDGSGDFDLVSKRGPPRGPRGPRKEGAEPVFPMGLPMMSPGLPLLPGFGGPRMPNGGMAGMFPFWPMLGGLPNGLHGPPPLIPVPGMNPLSIQVPHNDGKPQAGGELTPHSTPGIRCVLCDFVADNRGRLNDHMLKVHARENQDLLNMFGMRPEMAMEGLTIKKEKNADIPERTEHGGNHPQRTESASPKSSESAGWPGKMGHHSRPEYPPMSPKALFPSQQPVHLKERFNSTVAASLAATIEAEARVNGECPLDLTKATKPQEFGGYGSYGPSSNSSEAMDYTPGEKRSHDDSGVSPGEAASDVAQSPTPRKRSRKGKAYKLDTICMKLQERYGDSPTHEDEDVDDSGEAYLSDYNSDRANGDLSCQDIGEEAMEKGEDASGNDMKEDRPGSVPSYRDHGEETQNAEGRTEDSGPDDFPPPSSRPEVLASFSNSINRRKLFISRHIGENAPFRNMNGHLNNGENEGSVEDSVHAALLQAGVHKVNKHGSTYECNHCEILFRDCIMYTMHMGYHGYQDPFKCNMCGHCSKDKVEFFLHIARAAHA